MHKTDPVVHAEKYRGRENGGREEGGEDRERGEGEREKTNGLIEREENNKVRPKQNSLRTSLGCYCCSRV